MSFILKICDFLSFGLLNGISFDVKTKNIVMKSVLNTKFVIYHRTQRQLY